MKFRNEVYSELVNDLIFDTFYIERLNREKVASIMQYAEVIVRKILGLPESEKVTLGDRGVVKKLKKISNNNQMLMLSVNTIGI
ncbi:hypothetical protein SOJ80_003314 [Cronobacter universalis]|nr:hypothetical protein [Cronobacter universalis]